MNLFRPVKSGKVSELIARQIKNIILNGTMKPGDRLPPERELVRYFQASRISVREAIKSLESSGLLTIKAGSGMFVAEINSKLMSESFSSILRIRKTSINELTEGRIIFEPSIARLACERRTPEDIIRLEKNVQETSKIVKSNSPAPAENIEFHYLIAEATHNSVITLTMRTLFDVLKEMTLEIKENLVTRSKNSKRALDYHKRILEALQEKNSQKVYELMLKHIFQVQQGLGKVKSEAS